MFSKEVLRLAAFAYRGEDYDQDDATRLLAHLGNLCGLTELGKRYKIAKPTMFNIVEKDDFPLPVMVMSSGRIWSAVETDEFMKNYNPLKIGRPRKRVD